MKKEYLLWAIFVLAIIGMADSVHLLDIHYGTDAFSCDLGGKISCTKVNHSPYAAPFGIPIAGLGLLGYAVIAFISGYLVVDKKTWLDKLANKNTLLLFAGVGFLIQLGFTGIEAFILHAYCIFCLISQALILAIAVLSYLNWKSAGSK